MQSRRVNVYTCYCRKPNLLFSAFFPGLKMELVIENASVKHLGKLYEIEKQSFEEEAFSKRQIALLLTDYNSISFVARVGGRIVGFIIGRIDLARNCRLGHIMTLDVAQGYRRQGVGAKLMHAVERILIEKGVRTCLLEVREGNMAALGLYKALGYQEMGMLKNYYGKSHGFCLRKTLIC